MRRFTWQRREAPARCATSVTLSKMPLTILISCTEAVLPPLQRGREILSTAPCGAMRFAPISYLFAAGASCAQDRPVTVRRRVPSVHFRVHGGVFCPAWVYISRGNEPVDEPANARLGKARVVACTFLRAMHPAVGLCTYSAFPGSCAELCTEGFGIMPCNVRTKIPVTQKRPEGRLRVRVMFSSSRSARYSSSSANRLTRRALRPSLPSRATITKRVMKRASS